MIIITGFTLIKEKHNNSRIDFFVAANIVEFEEQFQ